MERSSLCAIVGAEEGLGASLSRAFARDGCDMALLARSSADSREALEAAREARPDGTVICFDCDATQADSVHRALRDVSTQMGPVDVLIYNVRPGVAFVPPLEVTPDVLREMLEIEAIGAFVAAKAVLPSMLDRGSGTLLFTSATAALRGAANGLTLSMAKFALRALTQSLTKAYASRGIHVVHVRLDCYLNDAFARRTMGDRFRAELASNTDDVALSYLWAYRQPRSAWSNEIDIRPSTENWTF